LLQWIKAHRPETVARTLFMTGDANGAGLNADIRTEGRTLLRKPISVATLLAAAERVLGEAEGAFPRPPAAARTCT
jgi:hypothetical protein